ncbi:MAG TPA: 3-deoxy-D-manno-octulosonic acid transferase [Rickettsiales bacterium]|nr:3-deoxy-D-manno-octulosonic acid transferase [Rickettsiales bacterium]
MVYRVYQILTIIFSPIIDLYLFVRLKNGKEDKTRIKERFGCPTIERPTGDIIWIQCASVGESNSALPLVDKIIEKYNKKITILITTGTITSAELVSEKIKDKKNIIHQYTPIDKYFVIKRFLNFWKPKVLITVESEIWPNMIVMANKICDKVMIVNAKLSIRSFARWKTFKNLKETIFDAIDICYPQSQDDQYRLINLGIQNTIFLGNLKFDIPKLKVNQEELNKLKNEIGNRNLVLFASSHIEEDETILEIYKQLKEKFEDILFVLATRHVEKVDKTFDFFTQNNIKCKRRSKNEKISDNVEIFIFDKMGEMGTLFELSKIVVMCGSLVDKIGGHTPVEPAKHNCAILTGPYIKNNKSLFVELEKNKACIICKNKKNIVNDIVKNIASLITNKKRVIELGDNAKMVCDKFSNVANNVAKSIIENLK